VQDGNIVSIELVCALSNGAVSSDLELLLTTPKHLRVLAREWQTTPRRSVVRSREPFYFWSTPTIYLERLKLEWPNVVQM